MFFFYFFPLRIKKYAALTLLVKPELGCEDEECCKEDERLDVSSDKAHRDDEYASSNTNEERTAADTL